jgi:S1-C subfamily serine protease
MSPFPGDPSERPARSTSAATGEFGRIELLAVLLLLVSGALVFAVIDHVATPVEIQLEPRPLTRRLDDRLGADEQSSIDAFSRASRSVVQVTSLEGRRDRWSLDITEIPQGTGSGFVWDRDGHIITNYHVVRTGDRAQVTLADHTRYAATIVATAPDKDVAVLHIDAPADQLLPLPIGQSSALAVGQKVLAIGNPFGLDQTLTIGVISGLHLEIKGVTGPIRDAIQTSAAINPGNSGGPLLDSAGRLIGIATAISADAGFAVPVDTVTAIVPRLLGDRAAR